MQAQKLPEDDAPTIIYFKAKKDIYFPDDGYNGSSTLRRLMRTIIGTHKLQRA
jgi:hypothetical protein